MLSSAPVPKLEGMSSDMRPNMTFLLMAQYEGRAIIPLSRVIADYFPHLDEKKFLSKSLAGQIKIPLSRIDNSQKAARGIALVDLANYLETRRAMALKGMKQLSGED